MCASVPVAIAFGLSIEQLLTYAHAPVVYGRRQRLRHHVPVRHTPSRPPDRLPRKRALELDRAVGKALDGSRDLPRGCSVPEQVLELLDVVGALGSEAEDH